MDNKNVSGEKPKVVVKHDTKAETKQTTKFTPLIYCGPSYKGVSQYAIFNDGLPKDVDVLKAQNADFAALIVPLTELSTTKQRIAISGTLENKSYISLGGN